MIENQNSHLEQTHSMDLELQSPVDDPNSINSTVRLRHHQLIRSYSSNKSNKSIISKGQLIKITKINKIESKNQLEKNQNQKEKKKKQCRICLQDQNEGRIIKPCLCTGTMQYAHQACLCEWIKRKTDFKCKAKVNCQVCDYPFDYKISRKLSLNWQHFILNYQKFKSTYRCFFILMLLGVLSWLFLLVIAIMSFSENQSSWVNENLFPSITSKIVMICAIIVYFVGLLFVVLLFLAEYGIKSEPVIQNILNFTRKKKKIIPKMYNIIN